MEKWKVRNTSSQKQPACPSSDTRKSKARPTPMTRHGRATMNNVSTFTWQTHSKGNTGFAISGRAKRTLPNVSAEKHQDHRLAQPSRSMEIKRWLRHGRKPRAPSSQLPPTITQPG